MYRTNKIAVSLSNNDIIERPPEIHKDKLRNEYKTINEYKLLNLHYNYTSTKHPLKALDTIWNTIWK